MKTEPSETLLRAFKNPTKLSIIALLLKNGQMTVTQLSKIINTTRPNLYRSIRELVNDGLILKPTVRVTKNYVEKYYGLNLKIFDSVKSRHVIDAISKAHTSDLRELMISFLLMNSLLSNVFVEQIKMASDSEMESYRQRILDGYILMSFSTLSDSSMELFSKYYKQFIDKIEKGALNKKEKEKNALVVFSLPI
ncbi:MAG: winged helix-turn-helix domain-containing protein [Nitrososphaeria archaeon]